MAKEKSVAKLRKELDKWFSLWVRISNSDEYGMCTCFTCGSRKHWKEVHAGHFMSRRHTATRWHESNVKPQCVKCNMFSQGEQFKFSQALGMKTANKMQHLSGLTVKFSRFDIEVMIKDYKERVKVLTG